MKSRLLIGSLLIPLALFAQTAPEITPIREQARTLYRQGQYAEARRLYQQIVKLVPEDVDALKESMWGFWNMESYDNAVEVARRLKALRPDDPEARNILDWAPEKKRKHEEKVLRQQAVTATQAGDVETSIERYRQLAALEPETVSIQHEYMWALWNGNRFDDASAVAGQILKRSPSDVEAKDVQERATREIARRELAALQKEAHDAEAAGETAQAIALYRRLATLEPQNPLTLRLLIWALAKTGQLEEAKTDAAQLIAQHPNDPESWNLLARIQTAQNQNAAALVSIQKSLTLNPDQPVLLIELAKNHLVDRHFSKAIPELEQAAATNDSWRDLYTLLGKAYYYAGYFAQARDAWSKALERFPDNAELRFDEAQARYYAGDPDGAITAMEALYAGTKNAHALGFIVDDRIVQKNISGAEALLKAALSSMTEADEPQVMKLAALYQGDKDNAALETLLNRFLQVWPDHQPSLSMKASLLYDEKRYAESLQAYQELLRVNPYATAALQGIVSCQQSLVHPGEALKAANALLAIDPTEPHFIFLQADALYQAGYHTRAHERMLDWVHANDKAPVLPVILYHDLTMRQRDPALAYPYHYSVPVFEAQMKAVHDAGYTPVTIEEVNAWLAGKHELPPKPIVIAFDDNRRDSFEYADPILEKYHLKATMFVAWVNVEYHHPPAFVSIEELQHYQATGRWELQSHGDIAHIFIPSTASGGQGLFLVNKKWLADQNRFETTDEWKARIAADHAASIQKMTQNLGHVPSAYAWPEGLYGQTGNNNAPETSIINQALIRENFKSAWTQDHFGLNVRTKDPGHMTRIIPNNTWTGAELIRHFHDHSPLTLAYLRLLDWAAWEGHTREAYQWFNDVKKMGASDEVLLREEAEIRFTAGDFSGGSALANRALMLGDDSETQKMVQSYQAKSGPQWIPSFSYQNDNRERIGREITQTLAIPAGHDVQWRLEHLYGHYTEPTIHSATDNGLGFGVDASLSLFHSIAVDVMGHSISAADHHDQLTASGSLQSRWTDSFHTTLDVGRSLYDYARSLDDNIWTRYVQGTGRWTDGGWDLTVRGKGTALSDDNRRVLGQLIAARALNSDASLRLVYRFTFDDTKSISPDYYSPQQLKLNEIGPEYNALLTPRINFYVHYLPGIGMERHVSTQLAHDLQTYLRFQFTPGIALTPSFEYERTPTYYEDLYSLEFRYVF